MSETPNSGSQPNAFPVWQPGDPLPNAQQVQIDPAKFDQYSMNPDNPRNLGKWRAFEEIGYDIRDSDDRQAAAQQVMTQLRQSLPNNAATPSKTSPYGARFEVRSMIQSPTGRTGTLVTIWQIDPNSTIPRLITNWLEVHRS
jgi:hypothetical protein